MKAYFQAFVNFKGYNWARLLLIVEFANNNIKNASTGFMPFKFNFNYYSYILFKKDVDFYSKSRSANKLLSEI